ncbi:hypothetical protein BTA51_13435 [Hahella sp. CCB-MM4]|uniref:hypothetical protein n=1 Tax=Hahella sp. (strain CCB-MM4) TaxID=1926491 RepID=UPI000B9BD1C8|nr:hypothetical protein [Hahella sp. CCB-MM4]OZG72956.1 hypothetical protein BTA51_13435 [Hahella sp. CCB-MM4]
MFNELLRVWSDSPAVSLTVWLAILITVLYLGRRQAHQVLETSGRAMFRTMRIWSFTLGRLEQNLSRRNREILLAEGAKAAEKAIEREFTRVNSLVERDLSQYPSLHRDISETIEKIEADYQKSAETAPLPPAWGEVVETISALPTNGDATMNKILQNIKEAVEESHEQTLKTYKKASAERHSLLAAMQPDWRKMDTKLQVVNEKITGLDERTKAIDSQIATYENIRQGTDAALSSLGSSALTQFFIAGLVLVVAALGGLINFQLIALPMSEMVGGTSYIGAMKTSDIAALVIILIEIAMGLFLLESLRITHLFPLIGSMDDRMRRRMMIITLTILTILATIEASLAYMRDLLALDREALRQSLASVGATGMVEAQFRWIPSIGQMVMGFILPFALAFIAIPLESFIHSLRTVLGSLAIGGLRALRVVVRMVGGLVNHLSKILISFYDLLIMIPLSIERLVTQRLQQADASGDEEQIRSIANEKVAEDTPVIKKAKSGGKRKIPVLDDELASDALSQTN